MNNFLQNSTTISEQMKAAYSTMLSGQANHLLNYSFERISLEREVLSFQLK